MDILETLNNKCRERGLQFLVIGGHAIIAHGYARLTVDLDLLVKRAEREVWKTLLLSLGYGMFHEQDTFAQFSPPASGAWPVDLMFANEPTFAGMAAASVETAVGRILVRIPSLDHIIALKLHALKHTHPRRELKDLLDVVSLVEVNGIDINGEKFRKLCERYGTQKIHDKIVAASSR